MQIRETTVAHAAFQRKNENSRVTDMPNIPILCLPVFSQPACLFTYIQLKLRARASARLDQTEREQASLHNIVE